MRTILTLALLAAVADAFAADAPMLPPASADQVPQRLSALAAPKAAIERAPVRFSWALDPYAPLTADTQPSVVESREYWQEADGAELQRGLDLSTSAPGALIRVSPVAGAAQVPADAVQLRRAGRPVALAQRNDAAQLQAAGLQVADGSAAVQLAAEAGPGHYALQVAQARGRYLVHVYEPHSPVRLHASLSRDRALAGGRSEVIVDLSDGPRQIADAQGSALLVAPSGRSWPVPLRRGRDGRLRAPVALPADAGDQPPGLWEVQVFAAAGDVQRDVRTALAVAQPTARLEGRYAFDPRRMSFDLPVRAASPGRYEVRGTLYASGPDRALRPVAIAHSAQWLDRGQGRIELAFDRQQLPSGFGAPFELRQLELNDQSRLAPVERRERAARIGR
ncbi:DUF4785 domain-containing protein [Lysobacter firmicutimachus]|uniref:DUF4785 domain-containing protein n=1 Tax=Lysobacter firmicutimachus TaxID=1792846 RepID=A0AAU8MRV3_9GAMM